MARRSRPLVLRARAIGHKIAESLFLLPAVMVVAAAAAAIGIDALSRGIPGRLLPTALVIGNSAARTLLSTIAGATITTVGVVFSIVVVSVQLASGQFSPRIVRNFFDDRRSKLTVGALSATFTYSVLALLAVGRSGESNYVPLVAVGIDVVLGLVSILSIVSFLNHSARRLYVGNLAERVMRDTLRLIERLDEAYMDAGRSAGDADPSVPEDAVVVCSERNGWLQQLSVEVIADVLAPGSSVRVETRVGAYAIEGTPLLTVWPPPVSPDHLSARARRAYVVGPERTMQQDVDFGLRQLSDIALRALSPSINDPHTAIEIILRHGVILQRALQARLMPRRQSVDGVTVYRPHELTFRDLVAHAFDDIRVVSSSQPSVARAVIVTCNALAARAGDAEDAAYARRQSRLTLEAAGRAGLLREELAGLGALMETSPDDPGAASST